MKREEIVRSDFPTTRKGYDPAAVDEHLRKVADESQKLVDEAARSTGSQSLAETAAESVRSIVEAAETKAREIEADARREADQVLSTAKAQARQQVDRAQGSVAKLIGQADDLRERIGAMAEDVIATADTSGETPGPEIVPEPTPAPVPEPEPPAPEIDPSPVTVPEPEPPSIPEPQPDPPAPAAANGMSDDQAARLVAMKMAFDGSSREEVAARLTSHYELSNPDELLESVFARVAR